MQAIVTPEYIQKKELDAFNSGLDPKDAMFKAGTHVFEIAKNYKNVLIVAGCGNNGGDGFCCGSLLKEAGVKTDIFVVGDINKLSEQSKYFYDACLPLLTDIIKDDYDLVIDAILGIGFKRTLEGEFLKAVNLINSFKNKACILSVDIPSGLNGLIGEGDVCVNADITVTFQAKKLGHIINKGTDFVGNLIVKDIDIPLIPLIYEPEISDIIPLLPQIKNTVHKGNLGNIGVIAGSSGMEGAAILATKALTKMCVGKITLAVEKNIINNFSLRVPEVMVANRDDLGEFIKDKNVILFGCGIGRNDDNKKILEFLLKNSTCPLVIDADGLYFLNKEILKQAQCPVILTPHLKEASRLFDCPINDLITDPVNITCDFAKETKVTVLLKSNYNFITDSNQKYLCNFGTKGMAKGGSGDVLAGITAGAVNLTKSNLSGCLLASFIHGFAGKEAQNEKTEYSMTPSDIIDNIYKAFKELKKEAR